MMEQFGLGILVELKNAFSEKSEQVEGSMKKLGMNAEELEKSMGRITRGAMLAGAGLGVMAIPAGLVASTVETQKALGALRSEGVQNVEAIEEAARNFTNQWAGYDTAQLVNSAYDVKAAIGGLSDEAVGEFTNVAALTAKATKAQSDEMVKTFTTAYGVFKNTMYKDMTDMEWAEMFSGGIAKTVASFKTNGSQMSEAIKAIGGVAATAMVPLEEQLAVLGQLQTTMPGAEAGTLYKAFMMKVAEAGQDTGTGLGLAFTDTAGHLKPLAQILDLIKGKFPDLANAESQIAIKKAFGSDESVKFILAMTQDVGGLTKNIGLVRDAMKGGVGTTKEMANAMNADVGSQWELIEQAVKNTAEVMGNTLLPIVVPILDTIHQGILLFQGLVATFPNLTQGALVLVGAVGAIVAVIGLAISAMGAFGMIWPTLQIGIIALSGALGETAAVAEGTAAAVGTAAVESGTVAAGAAMEAGAASAVASAEAGTAAATAALEAGNAAAISAETAGAAAVTAATEAGVAGTAAGSSITAALSSIWAALWPIGLVLLAIIAVVVAFKLAWDANFLGIADTLRSFWGDLTAAWDGISSLINSFKDGTGSMSAELADKLQASGLMPFVVGVFQVYTRVKEFLAGLSEGFSGTFERIKAVFQPVAISLQGAFQQIWGAIKLVIGAFGGLGGAADSGSFRSFGQFLGSMAGVLAEVAAWIVRGLIQPSIWYIQIIAQVISWGARLISSIIDGVKLAWPYFYKLSLPLQMLVAGFKMVWEVAKIVWGMLSGDVSVIEGFQKIGGAILQYLMTPITWARDAFNMIWGFIQNLFPNIGSYLSSAGQFILNAFMNLPLVQTVMGLWDTIKSFFAGDTTFLEAGKAILVTLGKGIWAGITYPWEMLKQGLAFLRRLLPFSDAEIGPLSDLTGSGKSLMRTLGEGILSMLGYPAKLLGQAFAGIGSLASGAWEGIKAGAGAVRSVFSSVTGWISGAVSSVGSSIKGAASKAWTGISSVGSTIGGVFSDPGKNLLPALSAGLAKAQALAAPLTNALASVGNKVLDSLPAPMGNALRSAIGNTVATAGQTFAGLKDIVGQAMTGAISPMDALKQGAGLVFGNVASAAKSAYSSLKAGAIETWPALAKPIGIIEDTASGVWNAVSGSARNVFSGLQGIIGSAMNGSISPMQALESAGKTIWSGMTLAAGGAYDAIKSGALAAFPGLAGPLAAFESVASSVWSSISGAASTFWSGLQTLAATAGEWLSAPFTNLGNVASQAWDTIISGASRAWNSIMTVAGDLVNSAFQSGSQILTTLGDGILSAVKAPYEAAKSALGAVRKLLPFSDAQEGPLSALTQSGRSLLSTLAGGITDSSQAPGQAVAKSLEQPVGAISLAGSGYLDTLKNSMTSGLGVPATPVQKALEAANNPISAVTIPDVPLASSFLPSAVKEYAPGVVSTVDQKQQSLLADTRGGANDLLSGAADMIGLKDLLAGILDAIHTLGARPIDLVSQLQVDGRVLAETVIKDLQHRQVKNYETVG